MTRTREERRENELEGKERMIMTVEGRRGRWG